VFLQPHISSCSYAFRSLWTPYSVSFNPTTFPSQHIIYLSALSSCLLKIVGDRGSTVVKVLGYKSEGRWLDPRWCHGICHWHKSFWSHYGPGVDSASKGDNDDDDNNNNYMVSWDLHSSGQCMVVMDCLTFEVGPDWLSRNVSKEYHYTLRNSTEKCSSHLLHGGRLKSYVVSSSKCFIIWQPENDLIRVETWLIRLHKQAVLSNK
jgi:hypothetical protein